MKWRGNLMRFEKIMSHEKNLQVSKFVDGILLLFFLANFHDILN